MRRVTLVLLLSVLVVSGVAAATAPTTVAEDPCGPAGFEATAPWQDLCALSLSTVATGTPTELEVRLEVGSTERLTPSLYTIRWDVDGCAVRLLFGDETPEHAAVSSISRMCEGDSAGSDCATGIDDPVPVDVYCTDGRLHMPIDPPSVEDDAYVWRLRFDGDIAEFAGDHAAGTDLHVRTSTASNRVRETDDTAFTPACAGAVCLTVLGDTMSSEQVYRID